MLGIKIASLVISDMDVLQTWCDSPNFRVYWHPNLTKPPHSLIQIFSHIFLCNSHLFTKRACKLGAVSCICNAVTQEVEAGGWKVHDHSFMLSI